MKTWKTSLLLQVVVGGISIAPALAADPNAMVREALTAQHAPVPASLAPLGEELSPLGRALAARAQAHGVDPMATKSKTQSPGVTHPLGDRTAEDAPAAAAPTAASTRTSTSSSHVRSMPELLGQMQQGLTDRRVHAQTQAQMAALGGSGGSEQKADDRAGAQTSARGSASSQAASDDRSMPALLARLNAAITDRRLHAQTQAQMAAMNGSGGSEQQGDDRQSAPGTARGGASNAAVSALPQGPVAGLERAHFSPQQQTELRAAEDMGGREISSGRVGEHEVRELREPAMHQERGERIHLPQAFYR